MRVWLEGVGDVAAGAAVQVARARSPLARSVKLASQSGRHACRVVVVCGATRGRAGYEADAALTLAVVGAGPAGSNIYEKTVWLHWADSLLTVLCLHEYLDV